MAPVISRRSFCPCVFLLSNAYFSSALNLSNLQSYTLAEVAKNNQESSCWVIVHGLVVNVTDWLPGHPGGRAPLMKRAGGDATEGFQRLHSESRTAHMRLLPFVIGMVPDAAERGAFNFIYKLGQYGQSFVDLQQKRLNPLTMEEVRSHNTADSCWIVVGKIVVDVTGFLKMHPGGAQRLLDQAGRNATAIFNDIGHSSRAHGFIKQFAVGVIDENQQALFISKEEELPTDTVLNYLPFFARFNSGKDWKHVHKAMGVTALASYTYRIGAAFASPVYGYSMAYPTPFNIATLSLHMLLSASALQFEVPEVRKHYYIIFKSYRLEVILFTFKYASATALRWYSPAGQDMLLKLAHVILTHGLVDASNALTRLPENPTPARGTRRTGIFGDNPFDYLTRTSWGGIFKRIINQFGPMTTQSMAVMSSLDMVSDTCDPHVVTEIMFLSLLPIQGHAFTMTLIKKGLLDDGDLKKFLYALQLAPAVFLGVRGGGRRLFVSTCSYMLLRIWAPWIPKYVIYVAFVAFVMRNRSKGRKDVEVGDKEY